MSTIILFVGLLYFVAHAFTAVFARTRIPDVLLLIVLGLVLGPVAGVVSVQDFGKVGPVMTTMALIVILFEGGTGLRLRQLRDALGTTVVLAVVTFLATMAIIGGLGIALLGLTPLEALILGATLGGSSSAVVIPMVNGIRLREPAATTLIVESALTDVLCIVVVFALLQGAAQGTVAPGRMVGGVVSALALASVVGLAGAAAWLAVLTTVRRYPNTLSTTLGFALLLYGIAELLGYSGAIAVLVFGLALTNQRELGLTRLRFLKVELGQIGDAERIFHQELVFIFKTFFFVYLGLSIRFAASLAGAALLVTAAVYAGRLVVTRLVVRNSVPWPDAAVISFMIPKGLAAAVLAGLPAQQGLAGGDIIQNATFLVILISILVTAGLVPLAPRPRVAGYYRRVFGSFAEPPAAAQEPVAVTATP